MFPVSGSRRHQTTLKHTSSILSGIGLHTGTTSSIILKPARVNHGYKFQRIDLPDKPIIDATLDDVVSTHRSTTLEQNGVSVTLVEHILAALRGMEIDNCLIQVDGSEVPIVDGSCMWFCHMIKRCGIEEQTDAWREYIHLDSFSNSNFVLGVKVDFESWTPQIGIQYAYLDRMSDFCTEIAPARTFALAENDNSMLLGMNSTNTLLFHSQKGVRQPELRFENEPARHKLLDVIGDLALIGKPIKGSLTMIEPGHTKNIEYARKLISGDTLSSVPS